MFLPFERVALELTQFLLLPEQIQSLGVLNAGLVDLLQEGRHFFGDELIPQPQRDVPQLLGRVWHRFNRCRGFCHQRLDLRTAALSQEICEAMPGLFLMRVETFDHNVSHDRVLYPIRIQVGRRPIQQILVNQQHFEQPRFEC